MSYDREKEREKWKESDLALIVSSLGLLICYRNRYKSVLSNELLQNYPNPFWSGGNPVTSIQYAVGASGRSPVQVSLKVYDILGNEVKTLVNER